MTKTKKLLSLALALAMALSLCTVTALAVSTVTDFANLQKAVSDAPYNTATTIELGSNITMTSALEIPANKEIILDLKDKTLDRGLSEQSAANGGRVFAVAGKLTVTDSGNNGKITGGNTTEHGGAVYVAQNGEFILNGGEISGNKTTLCGGAIFAKAGGKVTVNGGTISGNTAGKGNGIYVEETATVAVSGKVSVDDIYLEKNVVITAGTLEAQSTIGVTFDSANTSGIIATSDNDQASVFKIKDIYSFADYNSTDKKVIVTSGVATFEQLQKCVKDATKEIVLKKDITATEQLLIPTGKNATIDLNGFSLKRDLANPAANGRILAVDGNLTVKDGSQGHTGKLTGGNNTGKGGAVYVGAGGSFIMEGGSITANKAGYGGGVYADGSFTLKGGNITGNESLDAGGGVYANNTVTVEGGEISGNKAAAFGGGVYIGKFDTNATKTSAISKYFTMTAGKIIDNTANRRGGGVCVDYYDIGMVMTGGEISVNKVNKGEDTAAGGGIWAPKGVTVGGTAVVKNNTLVDKDNQTTTNNIHLPNVKYAGEAFKEEIVIKISKDKPLKSGASIGVTLESGETGEFVDNASLGSVLYFTNDATGNRPIYKGGKLVFTETPAIDLDGLFDSIFGFIRFKKTTDEIKTVSIFTLIIRFIESIFESIFG